MSRARTAHSLRFPSLALIRSSFSIPLDQSRDAEEPEKNEIKGEQPEGVDATSGPWAVVVGAGNWPRFKNLSRPIF
jgi:hypothetical protein